MAQKRMFDKTIIDSDEFLEMPLTTQALYFHLSMRADDDGFLDNGKSIMRIIGAKEDDMKVLIAKQYLIPFDTGIIVIRHWRINNYLQKDRKKATRHKNEMQQLKEINGEYFLLENGEISNILQLEEQEKETPEWQKRRDEAYKNSSLPYSFLYKIRNEFIGCQCPICKNTMLMGNGRKYIPTIQHLLPISKGGKHELDNIAIICLSCNSSIRDKEITEKLNNEEVKIKWKKILENDENLFRLTSGSIEENRIEENSKEIYKESFEEIWNAYPNKKGKVNAYKDFTKALKDGVSLDDIKQGLENYLRYIEIEKVEPRYIKNGSTWFHQHCWEDDYTIRRKPTTKDLASNMDFTDFLNEGRRT